MLFHRAVRAGLSAVAIVATAFVASPVSAANGDIVLHASDVTGISGNWSVTATSGAAGGSSIVSADRGWSSVDAPVANPHDYFEASFTAPANVRYHVWVRMRAAGNSKWNDSVWLQFSDARDAAGNPRYAIGTADGLLVNLENCKDCGHASWGWQDKAYWLQQANVVQFQNGGTHRIRVQTREDGVAVDQIVLSAATYLTSAPGPVANDTTLLQASSNAGTVATPVTTPAPAPPATATPAPTPAPSAGIAQGTSISVVTWNVRVDDSSAAHARAVMATLAAMSPQPQVVVIQEAHRSQYGTYIAELQARTGRTWAGAMETHCARGGWNGSTCTSPEDEGVAVFSSLPVIDSSLRWLPYADAWHSARAAVRLAINVNNVPVQVFGTHLQVGNASARNASMAVLKQWASAWPAPQLAAGDFNADMDQIDTTSGMAPNFVDSWALVGSGAGFTYPLPSPTMKLDYWFADASGRAVPEWTYVHTGTGSASDHYPVFAQYRIR
ncbi:MAG: endonuclease/exonuclease/phosphatase family protein [Vicinamibacterales bacterium]